MRVLAILTCGAKCKRNAATAITFTEVFTKVNYSSPTHLQELPKIIDYKQELPRK